MTDFTLSELDCLKDMVEADIDRSSWCGVTVEEWKEAELMKHYWIRAKVYAKLKDLTQGTGI